MRVQRGNAAGPIGVARPTLGTVSRILHHPIYAGAYSYGRRRVDHKKSALGGTKVKICEMPMSEWTVLQTNRLPAYITWDRFLADQERLLQVATSPAQSVRFVSASRFWRVSSFARGNCGRRMHATYRSKSTAPYVCMRKQLEGSDCRGLASAAIDDLVTKQVLLALEPAALEEERGRILPVAADIPTLWHAPETTARDRK